MRTILVVLGWLALSGGCRAPRHFPDPEQEAERARLSAMLDRLGEAPPVAGDELFRLVWQRPHGDDYVVTAGVDQDTGYVRTRRRVRATGDWCPPSLVFVDPDAVRSVLRAWGLHGGGWATVGSCDLDVYAAEWATGGRVHSCYRQGETWSWAHRELLRHAGLEWLLPDA